MNYAPVPGSRIVRVEHTGKDTRHDVFSSYDYDTGKYIISEYSHMQDEEVVIDYDYVYQDTVAAINEYVQYHAENIKLSYLNQDLVNITVIQEGESVYGEADEQDGS